MPTMIAKERGVCRYCGHTTTTSQRQATRIPQSLAIFSRNNSTARTRKLKHANEIRAEHPRFAQADLDKLPERGRV
jgi:hypothetical protein